MVEVPSMARLREVVDVIPDFRHKVFLQTTYLTAGRVSEIISRATTYDLQHGETKPYGQYLTWELKSFEQESIQHKLLLLTVAVLKRKPIGKDKARVNKIIALPVNQEFEPWTYSLLKYIDKQKDKRLNFGFTRKTGWNIARRYLSSLDPKVHTHSLRHWRISHLIEYYNFVAEDLVAYAGWTFKTAMAGASVGQLDLYAHLSWRKYIPKLLRPLSQVMGIVEPIKNAEEKIVKVFKESTATSPAQNQNLT